MNGKGIGGNGGSGRGTTVAYSIEVFEVDSRGAWTDTTRTLNDIIKLKQDWNLNISDMRIFFQAKDHLPSLLPRPSSNCFLVNMEKLLILCRRDSCLILHSEESSVRVFAEDLRKQLERKNFPVSPSSTNLHQVLSAVSDKSDAKLELVVLETVLSTVTSRFQHHLSLMRPILDLLLQQTLAKPSTGMLRRMLAFMKSVNAFEMRVTLVRGALVGVLADDAHIAGLCLTHPGKEEEEEMQLLLEAYSSDLKEVECELASIKEQVDDTNDFMNIHLNTVRNNFMKMTTIMEMGTLVVGSGALVAGMFGMNLNNKLEDDPHAFTVTVTSTCIGILVIGTIFSFYVRRATALSKGFNKGVSCHALEEFLDCLEKGDLGKDREKVREYLGPVVGGQMTRRKLDKVCRVLVMAGEAGKSNTGMEIRDEEGGQ